MKLFQLIANKKSFFTLLFINLLVQLGITYWVMQKTNTTINFWPIFIASLAVLLIMLFVQMPMPFKFILFCIFSSLNGLLLTNLKKAKSQEVIDLAIKGALIIFGFTFAGGLVLATAGINLGPKVGSLLFWSLLSLLIARLVFIGGLQMSGAKKILAFLGLLIFSIYVVYDTNKILQRNYAGDFITASMDYYLDILNLFSNSTEMNN